MSLTLETTVGNLVRERPSRSRLFERLGIDYCCGGKLPLEEACRKRGLEAATVATMLDALEQDAPATSQVDPNAMTLTALADHIEQTHHAYLREELPRLARLTAKIASVHSDKDARLTQIEAVFTALLDELTSHMMKEERILFPVIRQMEANTATGFHCGSIAQPIRQMEAEHEFAGNALEQLRALTDNYTPPEWACNTFRATFQALEQLEGDMHQHIHKENNVLFPKAIELEQKSH